MSEHGHSLGNLDPAARVAGLLFRNPRAAVYGIATGAVLTSWTLLVGMAVRDVAGRPVDWPGGSLIEDVPYLPLPDVLERFLALCLYPVPAGDAGLYGFAAVAATWLMMSVAMMLPSAAPLIRVYCEIVDTARGKGEPAAHPVVLLSGFLAVWAAASLLFALAAIAIQAAAGLQPTEPLAGISGAAALALAGAYQFTGFKEACLRKCRNPFGILFSRWSARASGVFRLGAEQGAWCLGCCWAMMLVMFVVGTMNVFWMALIALFTHVEKQAAGLLATRVAGAVLLVWSAALLVISITPA